MKFLVIEDSPVALKLNAALLQPFGAVDEAESGKQALEIYFATVAAGEPYDFIFVDYYLGDLEGAEVITEFRKTELSKNLPRAKIILVSGSISESNLQQITSCGLDLIIEKPLTLAKISGLLGVAR